MERGSAQHGPRIDDALSEASEPIARGAPVDPRVEEHREQEDTEGVAGTLAGRDAHDLVEAPDPDEVRARSELARHLRPHVFPARRDEINESAVAEHAT